MLIYRGLKAGSLCLDSSTIEPNVSKRMAKLLKEKKAEYLDAPVSGGEFFICCSFSNYTLLFLI